MRECKRSLWLVLQAVWRKMRRGIVRGMIDGIGSLGRFCTGSARDWCRLSGKLEGGLVDDNTRSLTIRTDGFLNSSSAGPQ
jgi:hypothetical protein